MIDGRCMICGRKKKVRHINLFVFGSEDLNSHLYSCRGCEMLIVEFIRMISSRIGNVLIDFAMENKK